MQKKRYLITGGTGFLGSALVKQLIANKQQVRVLDNNWRGNVSKLRAVQGKYEFIEGDIRNIKIVNKSCRNIDVICHLAYINGTANFYKEPQLVLDVAVAGIVNVLNAAIKNKVKELILISSSEVYASPSIMPTPEAVPLVIPDPLNPRYSYSGGKIISELMVINYGRENFKRVIIVRPHNVYGPDMGQDHVIPQFIRRLQKQKINNVESEFSIQGSGLETRSFVYIEDFIQGLFLVMQKGKNLGIYNIGTDKEITMNKLAYITAKIMDIKIKVIPGPQLTGSPDRRCPDITKIKNLGYRPKYDLPTGLKKTIKWYAQHSR